MTVRRRTRALNITAKLRGLPSDAGKSPKQLQESKSSGASELSTHARLAAAIAVVQGG